MVCNRKPLEEDIYVKFGTWNRDGCKYILGTNDFDPISSFNPVSIYADNLKWVPAQKNLIIINIVNDIRKEIERA